jgi:hypothetical protein
MKMGGARVESSLHDCSRVGPYFQRNPMAISGEWVKNAGETSRESTSQTNPLIRYDVLSSEKCRCSGRGAFPERSQSGFVESFPRTKPMRLGIERSGFRQGQKVPTWPSRHWGPDFRGPSSPRSRRKFRATSAASLCLPSTSWFSARIVSAEICPASRPNAARSLG